jgi:hypothetical protein
MFATPPERDRLPYPYRREDEVLAAALERLAGALDWSQVQQRALGERGANNRRPSGR